MLAVTYPSPRPFTSTARLLNQPIFNDSPISLDAVTEEEQLIRETGML